MNPYKSPANTESSLHEPLPADAGSYVACPRCQKIAAERVKFTWWGGVLGPKLFTLVRCTRCGNRYNGRTGGSNRMSIAIYVAVSIVLPLTAIALFGMLRNS